MLRDKFGALLRAGGRVAARSGYTRDQRLFIIEAMLLNSATVVTTGVYLTGLLVMMGATDYMVGLASSAGTWSLMLSLVASFLIERVRGRKALLTSTLLAYRLLTTLPVFLPMFMGYGLPTATVAAAMLITGNLVFSIFNTGFSVFMMDSLPERGKTSFIYSRMMYLRIAYAAVSLLAGFFLDSMHRSYLGFVIVFCAGLLMGIADVVSFAMIHGVGGTRDKRPIGDLLRHLFDPLRDRRYRRFLLFIGAFYFFLSISSAFTSLYQYKYLKLNYVFLSIYSTCTYLIMIIATKPWAAAEERIGRLKLLVITTILIASEFFVYTFLTRGTLWLIVLSPIFAGIGSSGFWACSLPYRYDLMPEEGKTVYEGWFGFMFGGASLLGAMVGGRLQHIVPVITTPFMTFSVFQVLYFFSGTAAIISALVFWRQASRDKQ